MNPETLEAYADRICKNLNYVLKHAGTAVRAEVSVLKDGSNLAVCRFTQVPARHARPPAQTKRKTTRSLLMEMPAHLRSTVRSRLASKQEARVYNRNGFWIIKPAEKGLWSKESARDDASRIVDDHLANTPKNTKRATAGEGK